MRPRACAYNCVCGYENWAQVLKTMKHAAAAVATMLCVLALAWAVAVAYLTRYCDSSFFDLFSFFLDLSPNQLLRTVLPHNAHACMCGMGC